MMKKKIEKKKRERINIENDELRVKMVSRIMVI